MRYPMAMIALALFAAAPAPVLANKLISPGVKISVAKSGLSVKPAREWNKLDARPGRNSETWTLDGDALNDVTFYGGIPAGKTLFKEVDKRNRPLPRVSATMLLTDIPAMFENSYRIALDTPLMHIDAVEPIRFAGAKGVRFSYSFTRQNEEVHRRGEARAAIIAGKLYMITFEAPTIHYFENGLGDYLQLADSAAL